VVAAVSLSAEVRVRLGAFELQAEVDGAAGETIAILGPNGAGKTTLLRALAGLVPLAGGRVVLGSTVLEDAATDVHVPPERRPIGVVFQDYLLFPHLSALENVAFGPRCKGLAPADARARAREWLGRMRLAERAAAQPAQLSGGQAQRVALARALAVTPELLLLDEPLAALDVGTRAEVRRDLHAVLRTFGGVGVLVTHDPLDALTLGDRLVVLEHGRIVQTGTGAEIAARPRSRWVADLVGVNLLAGEAEHGRIRLEGGGTLDAPDADAGPVFAVVHPRAVVLHRERPEGTARNVWPARVDFLDVGGPRVRVRVAGTPSVVAEVTPAAVAELALGPGVAVWVAVKATEVAVYPR
jgi:molybdate transport system ATP-binding protein